MKTSRSAESTTKLKKSGIGINSNSSDNNGHNNGATNSMLRISSSIDLLNSTAQIKVKYNRVDDNSS